MLGLLTLFLFQSNTHAYVPLDRIVAIVNDDVIMQSELETKIRTIRAQMQETGVTITPSIYSRTSGIRQYCSKPHPITDSCKNGCQGG